jgi:uncharacterized protein
LLKGKLGKEKLVLPVVHVKNGEGSAQIALQNTLMAKELGADGVFLIQMTNPNFKVLEAIHNFVSKKIPNFFIGVNYLDISVYRVFQAQVINSNISGLWSDDGGIIRHLPDFYDTKLAEAAWIKKNQMGWKGLYFGGVAFKYQNKIPLKELSEISKLAINYMDVVTTSGDKTGSPPELEKIKIIRESIGNFPLAIASGLSAQNVKNFLPYTDCFLVASSVTKDENNFDPKKLEEFIYSVKEPSF